MAKAKQIPSEIEAILNISNHDLFFKYSLTYNSHIDLWQDFIKLILPEEVIQIIDFQNIQHKTSDYITSSSSVHTFRKAEADITFILQTVNKNSFYLLIEYKSFADKYAYSQIFTYTALLMEKEKCALCPIIPVIFYHGPKNYNYFQLPKSLETQLYKFIPKLNIVFFDLGKYPDSKIDKLKNLKLKASFYGLKYYKAPDILLQKFSNIAKEFVYYERQEDKLLFFRAFLTYVLSNLKPEYMKSLKK